MTNSHGEWKEGAPLTPAQDEVLTILIEECAEVIQAASKLKRFGLVENPPDYSYSGETNVSMLGKEIGDVSAMIGFCSGYGLIHQADVVVGMKRKPERLRKYAKHIEVP